MLPGIGSMLMLRVALQVVCLWCAGRGGFLYQDWHMRGHSIPSRPAL